MGDKYRCCLSTDIRVTLYVGIITLLSHTACLSTLWHRHIVAGFDSSKVSFMNPRRKHTVDAVRASIRRSVAGECCTIAVLYYCCAVCLLHCMIAALYDSCTVRPDGRLLMSAAMAHGSCKRRGGTGHLACSFSKC